MLGPFETCVAATVVMAASASLYLAASGDGTAVLHSWGVDCSTLTSDFDQGACHTDGGGIFGSIPAELVGEYQR